MALFGEVSFDDTSPVAVELCSTCPRRQLPDGGKSGAHDLFGIVHHAQCSRAAKLPFTHRLHYRTHINRELIRGIEPTLRPDGLLPRVAGDEALTKFAGKTSQTGQVPGTPAVAKRVSVLFPPDLRR